MAEKQCVVCTLISAPMGGTSDDLRKSATIVGYVGGVLVGRGKMPEVLCGQHSVLVAMMTAGVEAGVAAQTGSADK